MRLDFLSIGAQKCATSWLYYCLRDHPELHLPTKKVENFYLGGDEFQARGTGWYETWLAGAGPHQKVGDASVEYMFDPRSAEALQHYAPHAKLVAVLRDPVDRARSAFVWNIRQGQLPEDLDFDTAARLVLEPGSSRGHDVYLRELIDRGRYGQQLARFADRFPPEQMMCVLFEEITASASNVLRRIYGFLEVEPFFSPPSLRRTPKKNAHRPSLIRAERIGGGNRMVGKILDYSNRILSRIGLDRPGPKLSEETRHRLREAFAADIALTQSVINTLPAEQRPPSLLGDAWNLREGC